MAEPIVHMPVVATTTSYDAQVSVALATDATPGVIVTVTMADGYTSERARVFAPQRGYVTFLPMGAEAPVRDWSGGTVDVPITVAADAVVLELQAAAYLDMQRRLDPLGQRGAWFWVIEGIDLEAAEAFLDSALTTEELDRLRLEAEDPTLDFADLKSEILAGRRFVAADQPPGTPITEIPKGAWTDGPFSGSVRVRVLQGRGTLEALEVHEITDPTVLLGLLGTLVPELANHPLVVAAQAVRSEFVTFDLVFQYWKPVPRDTARTASDPKGDFAPIPLGSVVTVRGMDGTASYEIATGVVGLDGRLEFDATGGPSLPRTNFRASTSTYWFEVVVTEPLLVQYGAPLAEEPTWSGTWSTQGLVDRDGRGGQQGSLTWPGAAGATEVGPLVYIVGIPVFAAIEYEHVELKFTDQGNVERVLSRVWIRAPKGLAIEAHDAEGLHQASTGEYRDPLRTLYIDEDGEIRGSVFEHQPGTATAPYLQFVPRFAVEDVGIALPEIPLRVVAASGDVIEKVSANELRQPPLEAYAFRGPMIGNPSGDLPTLSVEGPRTDGSNGYWYAAGALFVLSNLRDVHAWFHLLTADLAEGWGVRVAGRTIVVEMAEQTDLKKTFSVGSSAFTRLEEDESVTISLRDNGAAVFTRASIVHEFAHAVMLVALGLSHAEYARLQGTYYARFWDHDLNHRDGSGVLYDRTNRHEFDAIIGPYTAFFEGFAEIVDLAFGHVFSWRLDPETGPPPQPVLTFLSNLWEEKFGADHSVGLYERPARGWLNYDCEGAVAEALWGFLANGTGSGNFVEPTDPLLYREAAPSFETINEVRGDLGDRHPFLIVPETRALFQAAIWGPLTALAGPPFPSSTWKDESDAAVDYPHWASFFSQGALGPFLTLDPADRRRLGSWLYHWRAWAVDGDGNPQTTPLPELP